MKTKVLKNGAIEVDIDISKATDNEIKQGKQQQQSHKSEKILC